MDLTIYIQVQESGLSSTSRLSFKKEVGLSLIPTVNSIIALLRQEFTSLGFAQSTDGVISYDSKDDGLGQASGNTSTGLSSGPISG